MAKFFVYSDIDQTMQHNFLYDLEDIKQAIYNLLTTPKGTRIFLAAYGCSIESILFEPNDLIARDLLFKEIIDAIQLWESNRITLNTGACTVIRDPQSHAFYINLVFSVKGLSAVQYNYSLGISP